MSVEPGHRRNAVLFAVVTALLSSHAMDLGQLLITGYDVLRGEKVSDRFRIEGGLLVLAAGFVVLVLVNARRAREHDDPDAHAAFATGIVVGLLGGAFSILDKTSSTDGIPGEQTAQGVFILLVASGIFVLPLLALKWQRDHLPRFMQRLAMAVLIAALVGGALQFGLDRYGERTALFAPPCLPTCKFVFGDTSFYLSAPPVAGLIAGWVLVAVDPLLRPTLWSEKGAAFRRHWSLVYLLLAPLVSALYALGPYALRNGAGWIARHDYASKEIILMFIGVHLPAILACMAALLFLQPKPDGWRWRWRDWPVFGGVFVVAAIPAMLTARSLQGVGEMTSGMVQLFAAIHGLVAVIALAALLIAYRRG